MSEQIKLTLKGLIYILFKDKTCPTCKSKMRVFGENSYIIEGKTKNGYGSKYKMIYKCKCLNCGFEKE